MPIKNGLRGLGVIAVLAFIGCASGPDETEATFLSGAPPIGRYASAPPAAGPLMANAAASYSASARPIDSRCGPGALS